MSAAAPPEPKRVDAPVAAKVTTPRTPPAFSWLGLVSLGVAGVVTAISLYVVVHVHRHARAIEAAVGEMKGLSSRERTPRLPIEDALTDAARGGAKEPIDAERSAEASPARLRPGLDLSGAPVVFAQAERAMQAGDYPSARRLYCRFLASAGHVHGPNADWVASARFRLVECEASAIERELSRPGEEPLR